jgi:hypothetical protein
MRAHLATAFVTVNGQGASKKVPASEIIYGDRRPNASVSENPLLMETITLGRPSP